MIFDIEVFGNYFLALFWDPKENKYYEFIISEFKNDRLNLIIFLRSHKNTYFIGYNSQEYDMSVLTFIVRNNCTPQEIKSYSNKVINERYIEWNLCNKTLDLMRVNNFGPLSAKKTSLKKLEFNFRKKKIQDLPYHHESYINEKQSDDIVKYCKYDIEVTYDLYLKSKEAIKVRLDFQKQFGIEVLNSPEPDIVKKYFLSELSKISGKSEKEIKSLKTYQDQIIGKNLILDCIKIDKIKEFKEVYDFYKELILTAEVQSKINSNKIISLKNKINKSFELNNVEYTYAGGGLHAANKPGIYSEDDEYLIEDFDLVSFYPHLAFVHGIIPRHLDFGYENILRRMFEERKLYSKKTHPSLNYILKICLNTGYGLSNSEYGFLYDPEATLKTCVNGMLILTMLLDNLLYYIKDITVIQCNTDGITIKYKRTDQQIVHSIYDDISKRVNIPYELVQYSKMITVDVNNYIGVYLNGSCKTKGLFEDYEDIMNAGMYHKDTSASIIPKALKQYFLENIPIEKTINNEKNIYEFCYGNPKTKEFNWLLIDLNKGTPVLKRFEDRFVRYYAGYTQSIQKDWISAGKKGQIENLQSKTNIQLYQNVTKENTDKITNLNRQWYVDECNKIIKIIDNDTV